MRTSTNSFKVAAGLLAVPVLMTVWIAPASGLDLDLGIASVSVGGGATGGLSVGVGVLGDVGVTATVGGSDGLVDARAATDTAGLDVGLGVLGQRSGSTGIANLGAAVGGRDGIDLTGIVGSQNGLVEVNGTAAGIDIGASVLSNTSLVDLCVGSCGPSGSSSSGTTPPRQKDGQATRLSSRRICDDGKGNSTSFDGFSVVDQSGNRLGSVHSATIDNRLDLVSVRLLADAGSDSGAATCVVLRNVTGEIGAGQVHAMTAARDLERAIARARR